MADSGYSTGTAFRAHRAAGSGTRSALLDLGVGYGLILGAIWTPDPWRGALCLATLGWVVLSTWNSYAGWSATGIRWDGFVRSIWMIGVAVAFAAGAVVVASKLHTLHAPHGVRFLIESFWAYALWALLQQFILQGLFLQRLLRLMPDRRLAVAGAATLFALAHLPNPILTALTLVWGGVSCAIFLRYRNLYTVGIVHAVLGICVAVTVPGAMQHDMRVGLGYLRYRTHEHHEERRDVVSAAARVSGAAPEHR